MLFSVYQYIANICQLIENQRTTQMLSYLLNYINHFFNQKTN